MLSYYNSYRISSSLLNSIRLLTIKKKAEIKWTKQCKSSKDIEYFGFLLSKVIDTGDVILLRGDLGAGKTTLTRGFIRSKYDDKKMIITSPSYLLDNTYEYEDLIINIGKIKSIHHMDLYRLPSGCDLSMFNIPEIFNTSICIIEWPERMGNYLPENYLRINMSIQAKDSVNNRVDNIIHNHNINDDDDNNNNDEYDDNDIDDMQTRTIEITPNSNNESLIKRLTKLFGNSD